VSAKAPRGLRLMELRPELTGWVQGFNTCHIRLPRAWRVT